MPMRKLTRRAFSASAGLLLSPFVLTPRVRPAAAQMPVGRRAKRVLLFCSMGTNPDLWTPTAVSGESQFSFAASTEPLSSIKQHLVLVDGLVSGNPGNNHGSPDALSGLGFQHAGQPAMISVDQFIGDRLKTAGINRPIATLLLGADTNSGGGKTMFNRQNNLPTIGSPLSAYNTVFGATPAAANGGGAALPPATLLRRRKSVLDVINNEVKTLRQTVGATDRAKLDAHLESIRQIENRLTQAAMPGAPNTMGGGCMKPAMAPPDASKNVLQTNLLHMDIIVNAFACDITRVAALQFGSDQSMQVDLPEAMVQGDQHGGFLHGGGPNFTNLIKLEQWLSARFVDLVNKLKAVPEADGSGSLFDNTLVVWARDMGDAVNHNQRNMRFVFAGGANAYVKTSPTGRYLHFAGADPTDRHERALLAICAAMGIADFTGFGDPKLPPSAKTPLPGVAG